MIVVIYLNRFIVVEFLWLLFKVEWAQESSHLWVCFLAPFWMDQDEIPCCWDMLSDEIYNKCVSVVVSFQERAWVGEICVCVCVCVFACVRAHVYVCVCIHAFSLAFVCWQVCVLMCLCVYAFLTWICVHVHTFVFMRVCVFMRTRILVLTSHSLEDALSCWGDDILQFS